MSDFNPEARVRAAYFDRIVREAGELLDNPEVFCALGTSLLGPTIAAEMSRLLDNAFMPNIVDGQVTTPAEYRQTEGLMIIPVLPSDNELRIMRDAVPISQRTVAKLEQYSIDRDIVDQVSDAREWPPLTLDSGQYAWTSRDSKIWQHQEEIVTVTSMPVVGFRTEAQDAIFPGKQVLARVSLPHELQHCIDVEDRPLMQRVGPVFRAQLEGRAYYGQTLITDQIVPPDAPSEWNIPAAIKAEELRQQFATDDNPFPLNDAYAGEMHKHGLA